MCAKYMRDKEGRWNHEVDRIPPALEQDVEDFPGVYMREIEDIERFFDLDVYIYQGSEDGKKIQLLHFPSRDNMHAQHEPIHLLFLTPNELQGQQLGVGHFVYISDLKTLSKCYMCSGCKQQFNRMANCKRHMRYTCTKKVNGRKDVFPGAISKTYCTLIEKLFRVGITVEEDLLYFKSFIAYDFESLLRPNPEVDDGAGQKTKVLAEHIPVSVGLCASHQRLHSVFPSNASPVELAKEFLRGLLLMRRFMLMELFEKYKQVFTELEELIIHHRLLHLYESVGCDLEQVPQEHREEVENILEDLEEHRTSIHFTKQRQVWIDNLIGVKKRLEEYIRPMICLGFNSARYDLKIIVPYMLPLMLGDSVEFLESCHGTLYSPPENWHGEQHALGDYSHLKPEVMPDSGDIGVIKQHGGYTAFSWGQLLTFKDVYKFCSPNTNLASFMKMHGADEEKGFFPYQWLTSWDKLSQDHLPSIQEFETGLVEGENLLGKTEEEIRENYEGLERVWRENNMQNMRHFLQWYNMLDVRPFAQSIKAWIAPYHKVEPHPTLYNDGVMIRDRLDGVDLLKTCVSAPGLAQSLMNHHVARVRGYQGLYLFHEKEQELVHLFRDNITGGPSIVFNRHITTDQGGYIMGFDANALYAGIMLTDMPTGPAIRYQVKPDTEDHEDPQFIRSISFNYESRLAMQYLTDPANDFLDGFKHAFNCGHEVFVGPYRVDAINDDIKVVLEINGCWAHAHDCEARFREGPEQQARLKRHEERMTFLTALLTPQYEIQEIWTCSRSFNRYKYNMSQVGSPCSANWKLGEKHPRKQSVREDRFYGFLEVDISVPDGLKEQFSDFPPLFATVEVPYELVGDYMKATIERLGKSKNNRVQLVSGLAAEKILLGTPATMWYLDHGLVITKLYQAIEFRGAPILNPLVNKLTNTRRQATADGDVATANRKKLEGNSMFGKTLTDKDKHSKIAYVQGEQSVRTYHNKPTFKSSRVVGEENHLYEVEMHKNTLKHDTPIQLGKMILDVAKIRMCQWVYDFLGYFIQADTYKLVQMDTDSMYAHFQIDIDLARMDDPTYCPLEVLVKPERLAEFRRDIYDNCSDEWIPDYTRHFLCRSCCAQHNKHDQKTPLLFKLEAYGKSMTALSSKTYAMVQTDGKEKVASKGIQKKAFVRPLHYKLPLHWKYGGDFMGKDTW